MKLPQRNIRWLGAFTESLYNALPLLSIINFLSISVVLYTNVQDYLKASISWMTFPVFLIIIAIITSTAVLLTWIFLVPSLWGLRGRQLDLHSGIFTKRSGGNYCSHCGKKLNEEKEEK